MNVAIGNDRISTAIVTQESQALLSLSTLDPPQYGWSVIGSINNILPPLEHARRQQRKNSTPHTQRQTQEEPLKEEATTTTTFTTHTYHRGEAGKEARNSKKELLHDVEQTDTNHDYNPPSLMESYKIKIQFCISSSQEEPHDDEDDDYYFKEVIAWDFSISPLVYSSTIALEYGLSFGQMMDLVGSIQNQLDIHGPTSTINNNTNKSINNRLSYPMYKDALSWKDPHGYERYGCMNWNIKDGSCSDTLCGDAISMLEDDDDVDDIAIVHEMMDASIPTSTPGKNKKRRKLTTPSASNVIKSNISFQTPEIFRKEVQRRAKIEKILEHKNTYIREEYVMEVRHNHVCHICHARRANGFVFPCSNPGHAYCDTHLQNRLGFSTDDMRAGKISDFNYCPICCLHCVCAKCSRRLETVAMDLQDECIKNRWLVDEHDLDPIRIVEYDRPNLNRDILMKCCAHRTSSTMDKISFYASPVSKTSFGKKVASSALAAATEDVATSTRNNKKISSSAASLPCVMEEKKKVSSSGIKRKSYITNTTPTPNKTIVVPKVPPEEFPKEICNGQDLEPGLPPSNNSKCLTPPPTLLIEEDCNINYCFVCNRGGTLLCCEDCPRSFHTNCISSSALKGWENTSTHFTCPNCKLNENIRLEYDFIAGDESSRSVILKSIQLKATNGITYCSSFTKYVMVLSRVYSIIEKLKTFDFGYIFLHPVEEPDYKEYVSNPMSFNLITKNIRLGTYYTINSSIQTVMKEAILSILKDIETIWHNCMIYNEERSPFCGAALVQRDKCHQMLHCSVFSLLKDTNVKERLDAFVLVCEQQRPSLGSSKDCYNTSANTTDNHTLTHMFEVPRNMGGTCRRIAIFDPIDNKVIKRYTTLRAAATAAFYLHKTLNYTPEFIFNDVGVKSFIRKGHHSTLFGYRWCFDDDLREGRIELGPGGSDRNTFSSSVNKTKSKITSLPNSTNDTTKTQQNVMTNSTTATNIDYTQKQQYSIEQLTIHPHDANVVLSTNMYDTMEDAYASIQTNGNTSPDLSYEVFSNLLLSTTITTTGDTSTTEYLKSNGYKWKCIPKTPPPTFQQTKKHTIIKLNRNTAQIVQGFETQEEAFHDWLQTYVQSLKLNKSATKNNLAFLEDEFLKKFLHGDKILDGLQWRVQPFLVGGGYNNGGSFDFADQLQQQQIVSAKVGTTALKKKNSSSSSSFPLNDWSRLKLRVIVNNTIISPPSSSPEPSIDGDMDESLYMQDHPPIATTTSDTNTILSPSYTAILKQQSLMSLVDAIELRQHESIYSDTTINTPSTVLSTHQGNNRIHPDAYAHRDNTSRLNHNESQSQLQLQLPSSMTTKIPKRKDATTILSCSINRRQPPHDNNTNFGNMLMQQQPLIQQFFSATTEEQQSSSPPTNQQQILFNEDEKIAIKTAALYAKKYPKETRAKPEKNKRKLYTINISTLSIGEVYETFSACKKGNHVADRKLSNLIEQKRPWEGKIFVDATDVDHLLREMRDAVENWRMKCLSDN